MFLTTDFEELGALVSGKLAAAEDHIWALREDSEYFEGFLKNSSEHRPERMLDGDSGKPCIDLNDPANQTDFWDSLITNAVTQAYLHALLLGLYTSATNCFKHPQKDALRSPISKRNFAS
jgi:hypothetical protein